MHHDLYEAMSALKLRSPVLRLLCFTALAEQPVLLVAPKSPGPKDFMVMVGARAGVIGQD